MPSGNYHPPLPGGLPSSKRIHAWEKIVADRGMMEKHREGVDKSSRLVDDPVAIAEVQRQFDDMNKGPREPEAMV
jgi:hypothetical protein